LKRAIHTEGEIMLLKLSIMLLITIAYKQKTKVQLAKVYSRK